MRRSLVLYAVLGVAAAVASVVFTDALLDVRLTFRQLQSLPRWAQPAIGGARHRRRSRSALSRCSTRAGITGGGYATLGQALTGELAVRSCSCLVRRKLVATVFSYSSGGAGGIFAPSLFIGGMLGGAFGYARRVAVRAHRRTVGAFALVGMGAVFAGIDPRADHLGAHHLEMTSGYGSSCRS